jgi:hypothetical protein
MAATVTARSSSSYATRLLGQGSSAELASVATIIHRIRSEVSAVTFWYGAGSADPYHWPTDPVRDTDPAPVPDHALSVSGFQNVNKKYIFYYFLIVCFHQSSKIKKSQNSKNQGFSYFFLLANGRKCWMFFFEG